MPRLLSLLTTLILALPIAFAPAHAQDMTDAACGGQDKRMSLDATQRAELAEMTAALDHPEGNHWRATRGDEVLHLIGTLHVDDPRHDTVMEGLAPIVAEAAMLLVEATPEEEAAMKDALARDPSLLVVTDGPTLPDVLDPDEWARVKAAAEERGIPGFMAAKFRPWYLTMMLSLPRCLIETMQDGSTGLDRRLTDLAEAEGIPMAALEPYDTLFRLFGEFGAADQADLVVASIPAPGEAEDMFAALLAGYFEERHGEIWSMSHLMARETSGLPRAEVDEMFAQLRQIVVTDRNAAWMPVIADALARTDGTVVVAAGAAHLNGDDGMVALLEAEGFVLERLPF